MAGMTERTEAIHEWFGLTYANYLTLPRTLLQSMPDEWQAKFVALLEELDDAFSHIETAQAYKVEAAEEHEVGSLSPAQLVLLGISEREVPCTVDHDHEADWADCNDDFLYDSFEESDMTADRRVLVPCKDPVPHYQRGRTRVEPKLPHAGDPS